MSFMNYIVFDLEFNQDIASLQNFDKNSTHYPLEIIQIGAIKLDPDLNPTGTFNRYVKPTFYTRISPFVSEFTGITDEQLQNGNLFPDVYKAFLDFINETDSVFCIWGMADIKELIKNAEYHNLYNLLPQMIINLQPYASLYLKIPSRNMLRLSYVVELLNIPITYTFHNAFHDALYTAAILKKIYNSTIRPYHTKHIKPLVPN